jgi:son of sevenless-like protein
MEGSYRVFRRELEHVVLPCLPYVGVYLGDLTFIEEGNPDMKGDLINWDKRKLVHNIIAQIQKFQMVGYNLQKEPLIDRYLQETLNKAPGLFKDDREMYARSLLLEPRNAKREDIK